ncbi:hypothetical protein ROA7450_04165 [Roseovarius albus]|uniref:Uncharacterized protein n=1 Tax=Roseovarius albus TaxID=1247867 RepID=A0A1X7A987_9RHOB|nr:hypothetical protein ROA7450_04165 [Roseovarius albus]
MTTSPTHTRSRVRTLHSGAGQVISASALGMKHRFSLQEMPHYLISPDQRQ